VDKLAGIVILTQLASLRPNEVQRASERQQRDSKGGVPLVAREGRGLGQCRGAEDGADVAQDALEQQERRGQQPHDQQEPGEEVLVPDLLEAGEYARQ